MSRLTLLLLLTVGMSSSLVGSFPDEAQFRDTAAGSVALFELAKQLQCPHTTVPMPCPNQTQSGPAFAMHIPKTGGRTMTEMAQRISGQSLCEWAPLRGRKNHNPPPGIDLKKDYGNRTLFTEVVRERRRALQREPCFSTFEIGWEVVVDGFGPEVPPLLFTMLRHPVSWAISAVMHDKEHGRNDGIDDMYQRGCLEFEKPCAHEPFSKDYIKGSYARLVDGDWVYGGESLEIAKQHLRAVTFGITEYFLASECLWRYQFGRPVEHNMCDCHAVAAALERSGKDKGAQEGQVHKGSMQRSNVTISQDAMLALQKLESGTAGMVYAYALELFFERIAVAEEATGMTFICEPREGPRTTIQSRVEWYAEQRGDAG